MLKLLLSIGVVTVGVLLYTILYGGAFHSVPCILFRYNCPEIVIDGYVTPESKYNVVKQAFVTNFELGNEIGSCVAASVNGTRVIDLCGGTTIDNRGYRGTLQMVFSTSKPVSYIVVAMLVDRGYLQYEDKVTKYWPEFAQGGKENVTVGDIVRHSAGVSALDEDITPEDMKDLDRLAVKLARQPHNFNSKKTVAYHIVSQGFYINEIVRRTDPQKRSIGQFIRDEINKPLGVQFYLTVPESERHRVSKLKDYPLLHFLIKDMSRVVLDFLPFIPSHPEKSFYQAFMNKESHLIKSTNFFKDILTEYNAPVWMDVEIAAVGGFTNIETLAVLTQLMAGRGQVNGIRLLSEETAMKAMTPYETEYDLVLMRNLSRTTGGFTVFKVGEYEMMGWSGTGGSLFAVDPNNNISFAYLMNAIMPGLGIYGGRAFELCSKFLNQITSNS